MARRIPAGDRREHLRFEAAGPVWASLDLDQRVTLRNIAPGGALIEARLTGGWRSVRAGQISFRDRGPALTVIVRHVTPLDGTDNDTCLVGLEFVNLSVAGRADVDRLIVDWQSRS